MTSYRNPFRVDSLKRDAFRLREASTAAASLPQVVEACCPILRPMMPANLVVSLGSAERIFEAALGVEMGKDAACRAHGLSRDNAGNWRCWVVVSKDVTRRFVEKWRHVDDENGDPVECAGSDFWSTVLEMNPTESFDGPGQRFRHSLSVRLSHGHLVLSQSGGFDC